MSELEMKAVLDKLLKTVEDLKYSQNDLRADVRESCGISKEIKADMGNFSLRIKGIEVNLERIDHRDRANNVIVFGVKDEEGQSDVLGFIMSLFKKVNLDIPEVAIADVYKLGKNKTNCPIMIKFIAPRWVKHVFTKISEFKALNIVIANDRSKQEREARRELKAQEGRLRGAGYQTKIMKNKIFIEGKEIAPEDIDSLVAATKKRKVHDEGDEPHDSTNGSLKSNKKGRISNRDLLKQDKNNQSMRDFLPRDADVRSSDSTPRSDRKKPT